MLIRENCSLKFGSLKVHLSELPAFLNSVASGCMHLLSLPVLSQFCFIT